jgi:hypothetical protein
VLNGYFKYERGIVTMFPFIIFEIAILFGESEEKRTLSDFDLLILFPFIFFLLKLRLFDLLLEQLLVCTLFFFMLIFLPLRSPLGETVLILIIPSCLLGEWLTKLL